VESSLYRMRVFREIVAWWAVQKNVKNVHATFCFREQVA